MKKSAAEKPSTTFLSNQEEPKKHKPMTASASQISKITPNVPGVAQRLFVQRFPRYIFNIYANLKIIPICIGGPSIFVEGVAKAWDDVSYLPRLWAAHLECDESATS